MTETQVKYFTTVAEELSFSHAAQKLFVSQPAVSKNIALLESELGFMLFDRTGRHIHLTDEGQIFLNFILTTQKSYQATLEAIRQHRSTFVGSIRIGIVDSWSIPGFYERIATFFAQVHPNVELHVEGYPVQQMLSLLRTGAIDIGITYDSDVTGQKDIASKPFVPIVPDATSRQELGDQPIATRLIYMPDQKAQTKNLFVNEIEILFDQEPAE